MKKILFMLLLCCSIVTLPSEAEGSASEVKKDAVADKLIIMPSEKELLKRLNSVGMGYFAEKTGIAAELAGKKLYPLGINMQVELAFHNFGESLKGQSHARVIMVTATMNKGLVLEKLFEGYESELEKMQKELD